MIFKSDPSAALDKTRAKLSSVEETLASLRAKRAEVLLVAEDGRGGCHHRQGDRGRGSQR